MMDVWLVFLYKCLCENLLFLYVTVTVLVSHKQVLLVMVSLFYVSKKYIPEVEHLVTPVH